MDTHYIDTADVLPYNFEALETAAAVAGIHSVSKYYDQIAGEVNYALYIMRRQLKEIENSKKAERAALSTNHYQRLYTAAKRYNVPETRRTEFVEVARSYLHSNPQTISDWLLIYKKTLIDMDLPYNFSRILWHHPD